MEPEVTTKQDWLEIGLPCGTYYLPGDLVYLDLILSLSKVTTDEYLPDNLKLLALHMIDEQVKDYLPPHKEIISISKVLGYGVRLSMPGCLDCTDWDVYTNKREAQERAKEIAGE